MFLDKLKPFFKRTQKNDAIKTEYSSPRNEYYAKVSERYGTAQMLLIVFLTIFLLISLMVNSEWVTYENFYYFFSDFGDYITSADSNIENVIYKTDSNMDFTLFGTKFAVSGNSGMTLYTASGRTVLSENTSFANPQLEASDRYLLAYDTGGTVFRVYNIFSEVYSDDLGFTVLGASVSDSGSFALISSDSNHKSRVLVYNAKFKCTKEFDRADYVTDVSMNASGDRLAILSCGSENAEPYAELYLTKTNKNKPYADIKINGALPLSCALTENNIAILICDDRISAYNTNGDETESYIIPSEAEIICTDSGAYGCAAVLLKNGEYSLVVFDNDGKMVYNKPIAETCDKVSLYDGSVFLGGNGKISRLNTANGEISTLNENVYEYTMLARGKDEVLVCGASNVKCLKFNSKTQGEN